MTRSKLVVWGGNQRPLALDTLDSHASVSAFFLSKYLSRYFDIVNLTNMDDPDAMLAHLDACAMLSTFQHGFTSRILTRGRRDLFMEIRNSFPGLLCSITDGNGAMKYGEDIIFTVLPPSKRLARKAASCSINPRLRVIRMGWCADPDECEPRSVPDGEFNIFIDHPHYATEAPDCTLQYFDAVKSIAGEYPATTINVFHQCNDGIVRLDINGPAPARFFDRAQKVLWKDVVDIYRGMHVFAVTHRESAGLAAIEASMSGALLCVPQYGFAAKFVPRRLLAEGIPHVTFRHVRDHEACVQNIVRALRPLLRRRVDRRLIHRQVAAKHSWQLAADRVRNVVTATDRKGAQWE